MDEDRVYSPSLGRFVPRAVEVEELLAHAERLDAMATRKDSARGHEMAMRKVERAIELEEGARDDDAETERLAIESGMDPEAAHALACLFSDEGTPSERVARGTPVEVSGPQYG